MSPANSALKRLYDGFANLQKVFLFVVMSLLAVAMMGQILTRYLFGHALFGLESFIGYSEVWVYFIGASYGSYERSHIKAEFVEVIVTSPRGRNLIRAFAGVVSVVMSIIFASWSYEYCAESLIKGETTPTLGVPMILFQAPLLIGAILMIFYFAVEALEYIRRAVANDPNDA